MLHPGLVREALLVRPVPVLSDPPKVDLSGTRIAILAGANDPAAPEAEILAGQLRLRGAEIRLSHVAGDHALSDEDVKAAAGLFA